MFLRELGLFLSLKPFWAYQTRYATGNLTVSKSPNTLGTARKSKTFLRSLPVFPLPDGSWIHGGTPKVMHLPFPPPLPRKNWPSQVFTCKRHSQNQYTSFSFCYRLCNPCVCVKANEKKGC